MHKSYTFLTPSNAVVRRNSLRYLGFVKGRNFGHFGFDTRTEDARCRWTLQCAFLDSCEMRDLAKSPRAQILHKIALRFFTLHRFSERRLLLLACLLGCRECPPLASFLFKSLLSMCWGGPCPPLLSSRRSIKLGKSRNFNGSIGPGFIGPSFGVDSAD